MKIGIITEFNKTKLVVFNKHKEIDNSIFFSFLFERVLPVHASLAAPNVHQSN